MASKIVTFSMDHVTIRKLDWLVTNSRVKQTKSGLIAQLVAKLYSEQKQEENNDELV